MNIYNLTNKLNKISKLKTKVKNIKFKKLLSKLKKQNSKTLGPTEWPSRKPIVSYHDFTYQAQSWKVSRRVVAKVEWHQGELFPRIGFIVTNLSYPAIRDSPFLQRPRHGGAMDQRRQVRPELDQVVLPQVRGQPGQAGVVRTGLQLGQLHEKAGVAGGDEALVVDQSANQAD